jgi:hypothetical protein
MPLQFRSLAFMALAALAPACAAQPPMQAAPAAPAAAPYVPVAAPVASEHNAMGRTLAALAERDLVTLGADLAAATRIAKAARPQDTQAVACFTALSAQVAELSRLKRTTAQATGAVSALEASRVRSRGIDRISTPVDSLRLEWKCGPYFMSTGTGLAGLLDTLRIEH